MREIRFELISEIRRFRSFVYLSPIKKKLRNGVGCDRLVRGGEALEELRQEVIGLHEHGETAQERCAL